METYNQFEILEQFGLVLLALEAICIVFFLGMFAQVCIEHAAIRQVCNENKTKPQLHLA